ncbi:hypothetical protein DCC39_14435 [Pueribacillus theae]|uniref:DUF669 domain-containing protein n=1 Tax=Pueribacillus theae TaxID=2171751 RepID=A0A2U1JUY1_9BACI|nr:DUF669 domain-containing protein [Pueribacillus theae]PWA08633.1 hypothetical protein DCC39_14435 [Pueribacillus theae]
MNLKEMAAQILAEGFNPETDPVSDFDNLPDGEYDAMLTDVQWRTNDKGTEWLNFELEILNDGYENRKYFGGIFFSSEKMLNQNIKRTFKYAALLGVELTPDDLDQPELTLVEAFKHALGQQLTLTLKTSKSGFQNFDLSEFTPF